MAMPGPVEHERKYCSEACHGGLCLRKIYQFQLRNLWTFLSSVGELHACLQIFRCAKSHSCRAQIALISDSNSANFSASRYFVAQRVKHKRCTVGREW